jgi:uncharacterized protein (DUF302 family)
MPANEHGLIHAASRFTVAETLNKLLVLVEARGLKVFTVVDHSGEAEKAGLKMRPTQLVIFGSPKGGTPVMVAAPTIAIDLPLKMLVWEDADGKVWISYNSPEYLQQRHSVPAELVKNISAVGGLVEKALE